MDGFNGIVVSIMGE